MIGCVISKLAVAILCGPLEQFSKTFTSSPLLSLTKSLLKYGDYLLRSQESTHQLYK